MKIKLLGMFLLATAIFEHSAAASDMSCADWLAYRKGDNSMQIKGFAATSFFQGYIDATNDFADQFNGNLISEVSPGKFAPTPPTADVTLQNTIAVLDRACTQNRTQSAFVVGVNELVAQMRRRSKPIFDSMALVLHNLNDAKGYK